MATEPLSPWRFRLTTQPDLKSAEAQGHGSAFEAVRRACGLSIDECGRAWDGAGLEIHTLEMGRRSFPTPADFQAALSQLWLWGSERGVL